MSGKTIVRKRKSIRFAPRLRSSNLTGLLLMIAEVQLYKQNPLILSVKLNLEFAHKI